MSKQDTTYQEFIIFCGVCFFIFLLCGVGYLHTEHNKSQQKQLSLRKSNCYGEGFTYDWTGIYIPTDDTDCPLPENININHIHDFNIRQKDGSFGYYEYYAKPPFKCLDSDCYYKEFYIGGKVYHGVHSQALTPVND